MNPAEAVVRAFARPREERALDRIMSLLSSDIVYQNVPRPAMIGHVAVRTFIQPLIDNTSKIEFELAAIAVTPDGRDVLTERRDVLHYPGGAVAIPLMGIFRVKAGLISQWRDYPDEAHVAAGLRAAGVYFGPRN